MNLLIVGINGKMGQILGNIAKENGYNVVGMDKNINTLDKNIKVFENFDKISSELSKKIDVVIDFALPEVITDELEFCIKNHKKLIICSTGHNRKQFKSIEQASNIIPIFKASNTSIGIALVEKILRDNLSILSTYQIEIIEKHHKNKKDIPSGTAKEVLSTLKNKANIYSIRAGSVVGEHEILLFGNDEQISIKHIAESKKLFAFGAIKIAEFMQKQNSARLYSMNDLLNS